MEQTLTRTIFSHINLAHALREVQDHGSSLISAALDNGFRKKLLEELLACRFERIETNDGIVRQQFQRILFDCSPATPCLDELRAATNGLIRGAADQFPSLRTWSARDTAVQKYGVGDCITSHRDPRRHRGVIVIFTVTGSWGIDIMGDKREGPAVGSHYPYQGDALILRGARFVSADDEHDDRPFHRVSGVLGDRVGIDTRMSVAFRDVAQKEEQTR